MVRVIGIMYVRCDSDSDTLNPHSLLFQGMRNCHPGPASGRGGCFCWLLCLLSRGVVPVVSAVRVYGDGNAAGAASAEGAAVRVVDEDDS